MEPLLFAAKVLHRLRLHRAGSWAAREGAGRRLRLATDFGSTDDLFAFTQQFRFSDVRIDAMQIESEYVAFLDLVSAERPRTVVEIGTARGGTLFMLTRVAADDALLLGIDYAEPDANNFGGYADNRRRGHLYRGFPKGDRQRVEFLFANSHERATVDRLEAVLGGRPVDVLFIDGDHTYDGVRSDFEMYAPLVRSGGIIGFHDIVPGAAENVGGVPDFWREIKDASATEFVADWQQGGWGIGVLRRASQ